MKRRAFSTLDAVLALALTVALAGILARTVHDQRRAATAGQRVRHAVDELEAAAARLRAGEPAGDAVAVHATDPGWLRLTPADTNSPELFVADPGAPR